MKSKKRRGARTVSWGTPDETDTEGLVREHSIQPRTLPLTDQSAPVSVRVFDAELYRTDCCTNRRIALRFDTKEAV